VDHSGVLDMTKSDFVATWSHILTLALNKETTACMDMEEAMTGK